MNRPRADRLRLNLPQIPVPCPHRAWASSAVLSAALYALLTSHASAQVQAAAAGDTPAAARTGSHITPRIAVTETVTDNNTLSSTAKDAALITMVSPGISMSSTAGRLRGTLDYSLSEILYTKSNQKNRNQQALTARGTAELIENFFLVDANASIGQQLTSAFGTQSIDHSLANSNSTEVASFSLSPVVHGRLASVARYEVRGTYSQTNAKDSIVGDNDVTSGNFRLDSVSGGLLGWWVNGTSTRSHFRTGVINNSALVLVGLKYQPDVEFQLGINGGRERSDYLTGTASKGQSYGANASWIPSPRTTLSFDWQSHDYGNSHTVNFEHRMARSSWRMTDSQNVSTALASGAVGQNTNYELLFAQYASIEPDPVKRDVLVRNALTTLGLSPDSLASAGFLTGGPTLSHNQVVSFSVEMLRTTVTATALQTATRQLGNGVVPVASSSVSGNVVQRSGTLNVAHVLTPTASANVAYTQTQSHGDGSNFSTTLRSIIANWTGRLNLRTNYSLGLRHAQFDGVNSAASYRENAVFGTFSHEFN
ncbi:TIGR03016 family PEP-CTERM system-associated outer membrane protein [Roseateles koreensis]|uniref:TIGR03016 family PEP-CTERM system-associated outer membrane protein n=1 Tax=Roseateles koreensis TaxID=2987526 RepID=UPI0023585EC8